MKIDKANQLAARLHSAKSEAVQDAVA